jgi:hypothetical protein
MNEYIDRDALRQAVLESQHDNPHPRGMAHIAHDCEHAHFVAMVARFPVADVAPVVHGRWAHLGGDEWCCSACGFVITTEGSWDKPTKKYCEDCGAKMDGGADNG